MSSYTTYDFDESMRGEGIELADIKAVLAAWGNVDSEGACCAECGGEWTGGFLIQRKSGDFVYVTGWCDYTGWGCRDGTSQTVFAEKPDLSTLAEIPVTAWDVDPSDLNKIIQPEHANDN